MYKLHYDNFLINEHDDDEAHPACGTGIEITCMYRCVCLSVRLCAGQLTNALMDSTKLGKHG